MNRRSFLGTLGVAASVGFVPKIGPTSPMAFVPAVGDIKAVFGDPVSEGGTVVGYRIAYEYWTGSEWRRLA